MLMMQLYHVHTSSRLQQPQREGKYILLAGQEQTGSLGTTSWFCDQQQARSSGGALRVKAGHE